VCLSKRRAIKPTKGTKATAKKRWGKSERRDSTTGKADEL